MIVLVLVFAAIYYIARLGIFGMSLGGDIEFEEEQSELVQNVVTFSFLAIGGFGLVTLAGLWLHKTWGFWGTVALSVYTILFDLWALLFVQASAGAGIIPAAVLLGFVLLLRKDYLAPPAAMSSGPSEKHA